MISKSSAIRQGNAVVDFAPVLCLAKLSRKGGASKILYCTVKAFYL